ncbi:MAG: DNA-binding protein [Azoarcus sp.]|nr:DNA-binding protein [Azoarcus sp.]
MAQNPEAGDVVPGTRGGRKVRWKRAGSGKSAGTRVIYYHLVAREQILLVAAYAKAERENMPAREITKLVD